MTKKQIRENIAIELLTTGFLHQEASYLIKNDKMLQDDLVCTTILIILEYKPIGAIYKVYVQGNIKQFVKKIMKYQVKNRTSKFYKDFLLDKNEQIIEEILSEDGEEEQDFQ